ncbi:hypothetical protein AVEN_262518-1 [Araneus ventricosus]|uniref:Uncharacterized protein n=1 Tax=Araneus ventricosus TaxID=182803 RepID=A0A4Y2HY40_ARAVE|nr:hypothetical protein AVEN_262518-1 [Araneus ventricosus]
MHWISFFSAGADIMRSKIETKKVLLKNRPVYCECNPTSMIMENDALFHEYSRKHEEEVERKTALVTISNTSRQQLTNNNSNSTIKSAQRLTADQFRRDTYSPLVWAPLIFIFFLTEIDVTWNIPDESPYIRS